MSNYTQVTNFSSKDALISGNPLKALKGAELTTEFTAVQVALNSKQDGSTSNGTFTVTAAGFSSVITVTATWRINSNVCTLSIPAISGTSNLNTFTAGPLPANLQPATVSTAFAIYAADNTAPAGAATIQINALSSVIQYLNNGSLTGWTATGGKTGGSCTLVYLLD